MQITNCHFPDKETFITIPGPSGALEAIIFGPKNPQAVGIVCHPHPLYEGTMHNKVVTTLARTFRGLNLAVIRFNFRGVGKSAGEYANAIGEVDDLLAVLQWAQQHCPDKKIWLAGFSFGSYIAASVATQKDIAKLILIAPPVNHFDFASLPAMPSTWYVVQGDRDEIVPPEEVYAWLKTLSHPPVLIRLPNATHFFHGQLGELHSELEKHLKN